MSQYFISIEDAERDLLAAAAYLVEQMPASDDRDEAMSAVVPQYLARGEVDLAAGLADAVDDPHVRDKLLIQVAAKCADLDDDEYAIQLADAVEEYGLQAQARAAIAMTKASKGDFEKAREIADSLTHPDEVLAGVAVRQADAGDEAAAMDTLSEIDYPAAAVAALMAMAAMRLEKEDQPKAAEYLETAVSLALEIEHDEERIRALADIGTAFVDAGRKDKAIETLDRAREYGEGLDNVHRDALLSAVSQGFMHAGSVDLADRALDMVADKTQIANALLGFARDYWRRDEADEAYEALEESYEVLRSQRESETRDTKAKNALFASIAAQYAGFDRGERAIEIAEGIEDEEQSTAALAEIARIMTKQSHDELARQALDAIPDEGRRALAIIGMSDVMANAGENEAAISLLNETADHLDNIQQFSLRSLILNEIAARAAEHDLEGLFNRSFNGLFETLGQVKGDVHRVNALTGMSKVIDKYGLEIPDSDLERLRSFVASARANVF
ncbi:MAG TPA: hypothetical protein PKD24_11995 [Pyrinomonadaceae bacterium]|nr:hypothetical protein [Pyrinomonadaceae bacterium]HMP65970.1 hypothetical protein [Pyrinomonadaceae bacterium]